MIRRSHCVDLLFTLSLVFLFALCSALLLVGGAGAYSSAAAGLEREFSTGTGLSYVEEKLRSAEGEISLEELGGGSLLKIGSSVGERKFITYIYCREGYLTELFLPADREFSPEAGQPLLELSSFSAQWLGKGLLRLDCQGDSTLLFLPAQAGEEGRS